MTDQTPVIVCLKWGEKYPTIYTNTLYRALKDIMSVPFRFVCITDFADGLDEGIEVSPLPHFAMERPYWTRGMWPKMAIFRHGLFEPGTPVLYLDVDVVVTGDLAGMIDHVRRLGGLHVPQDWHDTHERWFPRLFPKDRITHGAVIGFLAGEQDQLYDLVKDRDHTLIDEYGDDQVLIHRHATNRQYFPPEWILSFKKSLAFHAPVSLVRLPPKPPETCRIVSFHGVPNPQEVSGKPFKRWGSAEKFGFFPVPWVKRYWDRYSRGA